MLLAGLVFALAGESEAKTFPPPRAFPDSLESRVRRASNDPTLPAWRREALVDLADRARRASAARSASGEGATQVGWSEILSTVPTQRDGPSLVYDPRRDRLILFGGYDRSFYRNEVWTLSLADSGAWARITPSGGSPAGRSRHAAIYDPVRDALVVFGGWDGFTSFADVWRLSLGGAPSWTALTPAGPSPSARAQLSAVYDPAGDRMMIFGGAELTRTEAGTDTQALDDVWALGLSGSPSWALVLPGSQGPPSSGRNSGIYDPVRRRFLILGGDAGAGTLEQGLWAFGLDQLPSWTRLGLAGSSPDGIRDYAAIYDRPRDRMLVFGGNAPTRDDFVNDVWSFSLAGSVTGAHLTPAGTPPTPRSGASAILDAPRDRMIVHGGWLGSSASSETWQLTLGASPTWTRLTPTGASPPVVGFHTAIYDPVRQRMVVFGGWNGMSLVNSTHALSLSGFPTWTALATAGTPPSPRDGQVAVYDSVGDRMLLFGGNNGSALLDEVWSLSFAGTPTWTLLSPGGKSPPGRFECAGILDPVTRRLLVAGGQNSIGGYWNDVWSLGLSGSPSWGQLWPPPTGPGPRSLHSMILDSPQSRLIVFGGFGGYGTPGFLNDCWQLPLAPNPSWSLIGPTGAPPSPRDGHVAVFDSIGGRMIVFGGNDGTDRLNDVFSLSLGQTPTWTAVSIPWEAPDARYQHAAAYDPVRQRMLVFGGNRGAEWLGDTWALDLSGSPVWTEVLPDPEIPMGMAWHSAIYDPLRERMIVFGGQASGSDAWALSLAGTPSWSRIAAQGPSPRYGQSAIYDPERDRLVIFGGTSFVDVPPAFNDVWALSLAGTPSWTQILPTGTPPSPRENAAAVYDPDGDRMIVYGGDLDYESFRDDAYALSLGGAPTWTHLTPTGSPGARTDAAVSLDESANRLVMFGGQDDNGFRDDLWALTLGAQPAWSVLAGPAQGPAPRRAGRVIFDPLEQRLVVFGGVGDLYYDDLWLFSLGNQPAWSPVASATDPPIGRMEHTAIYDKPRRRMIVWGGSNGTALLNDLWQLDLGSGPVAVDSPPPIVEFGIEGPWPNPAAADRLWVRFRLPDARPARLAVLDIGGRVVRERVVTASPSGVTRVNLAEGGPLRAGIYFVRLSHGSRTAAVKVAVVQ